MSYLSKKNSVKSFYKRFARVNKDLRNYSLSQEKDKKVSNKISVSLNFYLLDSYTNIKNIKTLEQKQSNNNIILLSNKDGKLVRNIYLLNDLIKLYDFIKIECQTTRLKSIGVLIPKKKYKSDLKKTLLDEIKKSPLIKEIGEALKVNFEKDDIELKEADSSSDTPDYFKTKFNIIKKKVIIITENKKIFNDNKIINKIKDNNIINVIIDNNNLKTHTFINKKSNLKFGNNMNNQLQTYENNEFKKNNSNINLEFNKFKNSNRNLNQNNDNDLSKEQLVKKVKEMEKQIQFTQKMLMKLMEQKNIDLEDLDTSRSSNSNLIHNIEINNNIFNSTRTSKIANSKGLYMSKNERYKTATSKTNQQELGSLTLTPNISSKNISPHYNFSTKGLKNIGSTYYINATLQCLLHLNDLADFFYNEYPNHCAELNEKNSHVDSQGSISKAFYEIVLEANGNSMMMSASSSKITVTNRRNKNSSLNLAIDTSNDFPNLVSNIISPVNFKRVVGYYNPLFRKSENEPKDLVLFLMQAMHEELNHLGDNSSFPFIGQPNQFNEVETYNHFMNTYNIRNFSIISSLFYGKFKNITKCKECSNIIYNFQTFSLLTFGTYNYQKKSFNIYNGFDDFEKPQILSGNNTINCINCKKPCEAENLCKIIQPPNILVINIDYDGNKNNKPSNVEFEETIDITKYVFNSKEHLRYRITCICTLLDNSENKNKYHYIAYCKDKINNQWFKFDDTFCSQCDSKEIYTGIPHLLFYEKINNK